MRLRGHDEAWCSLRWRMPQHCGVAARCGLAPRMLGAPRHSHTGRDPKATHLQFALQQLASLRLVLVLHDALDQAQPARLGQHALARDGGPCGHQRVGER
jgi:hypothetical protein